MHAMLLFLWSSVVIGSAHAGGEVPSEPLVLVHSQFVQSMQAPSAAVRSAASSGAAAWLARAQRRHKTARTGGTLVGLGLPAMFAGSYLAYLGGVTAVIGTDNPDNVVPGLLIAGSTLAVGGLVTTLTGMGIYTIASVSTARALTLAGYYTGSAVGIAGIVCFGLSWVPTPYAWVASIGAILLGAVQTTINGTHLRALEWSVAPAMLEEGTPGIAFALRF